MMKDEGALSLHRDDDLATRVTFTQITHGFGNFTQRMHSVYNRTDLSTLEHFLQNREILRIEICYEENHLLTRSERRQSHLYDMSERSDDEIGFWSADDDNSRIRGQDALALSPRAAACDIEQQVIAFSAAGEIFFGVVNDMI